MVVAAPRSYPTVDMARLRAYNVAPTIPGSFGDFIRQCRDVEQWSQEEFAGRVNDGMSAADVSQLERGKVSLPKPPRMIALARALHRPVVELYVAAGYPEFCQGIETWALCMDSNGNARDVSEASGGRTLADLLASVRDVGDRHAIEVYARFIAGEDVAGRVLTTSEERRILTYRNHVAARTNRGNR